MQIGRLVFVLATGLVIPATAWGQSPPTRDEARFEVSASASAASLFIIDGPSFGTRPNLGLGVAAHLGRNWWAKAEVDTTLGLDAQPVSCALVNIECFGGGREGYESATSGVFSVGYRFGRGPVQAYASGGFGFLRAKGFTTTTFATTGEQVETERTDTGWGPTVSAGLRIPMASRWALTPEFRLSGADGPNLTQTRFAVGVVRAW